MIDVNKVKSSNPIQDVIAKYVRLKKSGTSLLGLCPFHKEDTPSFYVHPDKQYFKCFGCDMGGDVFTFIQEIEHVQFKEALKILAERAGIKISDAALTREDKRNIYREYEERELVEFLHLRDKIPMEKAAIVFHERCEADPKYRAWHKDDLRHSKRVCWAIVDMLTKAQKRDGDFPVVKAE